jgi:hypothetical protein
MRKHASELGAHTFVVTLNVKGIRDNGRWVEVENQVYWDQPELAILTEKSRSKKIVATTKKSGILQRVRKAHDRESCKIKSEAMLIKSL